MANVENVVVIRFPEPSNAYQALSVLKQADADGRIELRAAAIVERTPEGQLRIPEGADNVGLEGTAAGGLIGMLVGILGGPLGMLLGWGTGALVGGVVDLTRAEKGDDALTMFGGAISPGSTAVIADVAEPAIEVVDGEMAKLSGEVTRRPVDDVWRSSRRPRRLPKLLRRKRGGRCVSSARRRSPRSSVNGSGS